MACQLDGYTKLVKAECFRDYHVGMNHLGLQFLILSLHLPYKWGHYEPVTDKPVPVLSNKRVRVPCNTNDINLGSVHSVADDADAR